MEKQKVRLPAELFLSVGQLLEYCNPPYFALLYTGRPYFGPLVVISQSEQHVNTKYRIYGFTNLNTAFNNQVRRLARAPLK